MKVNVLTTIDDLAVFNFPLQTVRRGLRECGIDLNLVYAADENLARCDAVFVNSKYFRSVYRERLDEVKSFLSGLSRRGARVAWFDTTDGTGTTQFEILPCVKAYCKTQVLKDRTLYARPFYGGRVYSDYYHRERGVRDADESYKPAPLPAEEAAKIRISWNSALGCGWSRNYFDHGFYYHFYKAIYRMRPSGIRRLPLPLKRGPVSFADPGAVRSLPISCRISTGHGRASVLFQRLETARRLRDRGIDTSKVDKAAYHRELRNARVAVSPFGWGEICWRDWDILAAGALLLKPDMSHLETWPDLFSNGDTYVAYKWDFSDFDEKITRLLDDPDETRRMAARGQTAYGEYLSSLGRGLFSERVAAILRAL
ncbi:MAG: glycosyltransferase [Elusimicrobiota bacterium]